MFKCKAVNQDFFNTASVKVINRVDLQASPETLFTLFKDGDAWTEWFNGMHKVTWTSSEPFREGTTRTIHLGLLITNEYFFTWEENKRFAFYLTETNLPFVEALAEDYLLEKINDTTTRFTYTAAYNPALPIKLLGPIGRALINRTFKKATLSLQRYVNTGAYSSRLSLVGQ